MCVGLLHNGRTFLCDVLFLGYLVKSELKFMWTDDLIKTREVCEIAKTMYLGNNF